MKKLGISYSNAAKDLLTKLLDKDRTKRLGAKGMAEILAHPWFEGVDVNKYESY